MTRWHARVAEALVPARTGRGFRWMVASSWATNLGDGVALAAGPLLIASQTSDARLVALAAALHRLPWLVVGLLAGVLADRLHRGRILVLAHLMRVGVLAVLCVTIATGHVHVALILGVMCALGFAEVFADTTSATLTPMLVPRAHLGTANSRLQAGFLTGNQLIGPPLGAFLFAAGMVWPFAVQGIAVALGIVLVLRIFDDIGRPGGAAAAAIAPGAKGQSGALRADPVAGVRWLMGHAPVRTLALVIFTFNITWAASWSVLVLWSAERVGMGPLGFGLLTTAAAVGGVLATFSYGRLERRFELATLMRVCLICEVVMHAVLALTTEAWLALLVMFGSGFYTFVWGTVTVTVRQRAVPDALQGRVGSVYTLGLFAGLIVGNVVGGLVAHAWGLAAPFWFAFVGSALTLLWVWRRLGSVAHAPSPSAGAAS